MRSPRFRQFLFVCVLGSASACPGCGPEGAGTVHADRSAVSGVMVIPNRNDPGPSRRRASGGQPLPNPKSSRR
jgi:hypothetical protein